MHISKNIKYTKTQGKPRKGDETMETLETRYNHVFANIVNPQQRISTNLTKRFPVTSNRGDKYLFLLYNYDNNSIMFCPMINRTGKDLIYVFQDLHEHLTARCLNHNCVWLDTSQFSIRTAYLSKQKSRSTSHARQILTQDCRPTRN